jgi:hypothetical protein
MMKTKESKMTQVEPNFKPVPGETAEEKKDRLAAKKEFQQKQLADRWAAQKAARDATLAERSLVMKPLLFDLMLKAREYHVEANLYPKDPDNSYSTSSDTPGVKFEFGNYDNTYLSLTSEQWEVDQVLAQFQKMDDEKAEQARQEALRASAREKLLNVLTVEERKALGMS